MQNIMGQMRAAIQHYDMIENGDRIAIGVSGGKDSIVLLSSLAKIRNYYPKKFELVAITIDPQFNDLETDFSKVEALCDDLNIKYIVRRSTLGKIIFDDRQEKSPCSLCSRMRRGMLHNIAKESGCNRISLGHHYDDAVQTFFMNLFNNGRIGCFSPKSYLSRKDLWLIRPMVFCNERDIASCARRYNLPIVKSLCPVDGDTNRKYTEDLIKNLELNYPDLRSKIIGAMQRGNIDKW